jgi:hypothetical protein
LRLSKIKTLLGEALVEHFIAIAGIGNAGGSTLLIPHISREKSAFILVGPRSAVRPRRFEPFQDGIFINDRPLLGRRIIGLAVATLGR